MELTAPSHTIDEVAKSIQLQENTKIVLVTSFCYYTTKVLQPLILTHATIFCMPMILPLCTQARLFLVIYFCILLCILSSLSMFSFALYFFFCSVVPALETSLTLLSI